MNSCPKAHVGPEYGLPDREFETMTIPARLIDLLAIYPVARGPANPVRVFRNSLPVARISWCPTDRPWRGWQPPAELPVGTETSRLPGRSHGDEQPDVSHSGHMAAATPRANGSALLSVVAALAMSVSMHGATTVQPTMELTTMAVGSIETTAATAPAREPTTAVLAQGSDVTAVVAAVLAVGGEAPTSWASSIPSAPG